MTDAKQLPERSSLPIEKTWDLTKIFKDDQAFDEAFQALSDELKEVEQFKGTLGNGSAAFLSSIEMLLSVYRKIEVIYVYAHLKNDQDTANTTYQALYARASSLLAQASEAVAWFEPEVLSLNDEKVWGYFDENTKLETYRHFIENILSERPHILSADQEALLAGAGEIFEASSNTFSILNNADLKFPVIENENGEKIQLTHGVYGQLMENTHRDYEKKHSKDCILFMNNSKIHLLKH